MVVWSQGSRNQASNVYKAFTVDSPVQQVGFWILFKEYFKAAFFEKEFPSSNGLPSLFDRPYGVILLFLRLKRMVFHDRSFYIIKLLQFKSTLEMLHWIFFVVEEVEKTVCIVQSACINVHTMTGKDFIPPLPFPVREGKLIRVRNSLTNILIQIHLYVSVSSRSPKFG